MVNKKLIMITVFAGLAYAGLAVAGDDSKPEGSFGAASPKSFLRSVSPISFGGNHIDLRSWSENLEKMRAGSKAAIAESKAARAELEAARARLEAAEVELAATRVRSEATRAELEAAAAKFRSEKEDREEEIKESLFRSFGGLLDDDEISRGASPCTIGRAAADKMQKMGGVLLSLHEQFMPDLSDGTDLSDGDAPSAE